MLQIVYSLTLFVSATLLFWIQLFSSKMLLPVLGGSAAVWNTCMMFFQTALLLGYLYAHVTDRWLHSRFRSFLHPALLLMAAVVLPVSLRGIQLPAGDANPIIWLLRTLFYILGPPFLFLAGTTPIVQTWFAQAGQKSSSDPYFLYAASNLGSVMALLSYPTLIEPNLDLTQQSRCWTIGYFLLIGLTIVCAITATGKSRKPVVGQAPLEVSDQASIKPGAWMRLRWILLAFAPSSLLLGVTTHLTTDIAAAPLFWVIPLVLYLFTFVLAFQRLFRIPENVIALMQATLVVVLAVTLLTNPTGNVIPLFVLHVAAFFLTALLCHMELVRLRPAAQHLTEFYLLMSVGGALGGTFNACLAPFLFNDVIEYPLMLVFACMLRPGILPGLKRAWSTLGDFAWPVCIFLLFVLLYRYTDLNLENLTDSKSLIVVLIVAFTIFAFQQRPIRFGLGIAALIAASVMISDTSRMVAQTRNFYGVLKVFIEDSPPLHVLYNGTTRHGSQALDAKHRSLPLNYYHPQGPLGQLFAAVTGTTQTRRVGLVGLGVGAVASYAKPGEHWTFFEINPADVAIANDPVLFTFLKDSPAHPDIVLGDARLLLTQQPDQSFDMIILDAFSSDAIPIHLMTREAVELYLRKLRPGGLILFHITNRHLELGPVVANIADCLNLAAIRWYDQENDETNQQDHASYSNETSEEGEKNQEEDALVKNETSEEVENNEEDNLYTRDTSDWVIVARSVEDFQAIIKDDDRWETLMPSGERVWTDAYSNLLGALIY
jgi:hypothetical protein